MEFKMQCVYCCPSKDVIIKSFQNFHLVLDPYPLCLGHMMLLSKEHYGCTGELPLNNIKECQEILAHLLSYLGEHFGNFVYFEHGRAGICTHDHEGPPCFHMHLHVMPVKVDISATLSKKFFHEKIQNLEDLRKYFHGFGEYFFFSSQNLGKCYFINNQAVPSHYLRTLIAEDMGKSYLSDWENYNNAELIEKNLKFKQQIGSWLEHYLSR